MIFDKRHAVFAVICLLINIRNVYGYEDLTHQQLSKTAVKVAGANAQGVPPDLVALFVDPQGNIRDLGLQVMYGAGQHLKGEDYTISFLHPIHFTHSYPGEVLSHFWSGILNQHSARWMLQHYFDMSVELWKRGEKQEAAFDLGRCVHLVEDMAAPQHALDEMHCPEDVQRLGLGNRVGQESFLEDLTEAHIKEDGVQYCPEKGGIPQGVYLDKIPDIAEYDSVSSAGQAISVMRGLGAIEGRSFYGRLFTTSFIKETYPLMADLDHLCPPNQHEVSLFWISFQYGGAFMPFSCSTHQFRNYAYNHVPGSVDFDCLAQDSGASRRVDFGMKLYEGEIGAEAFSQYHTEELLSPAVGYSAGLIVYFWKQVKDDGCSGRTESAESCTPDLPPTPAGESPDDSVQVKAAARAESAGLPAFLDWRPVSRVGIGRESQTGADYGISSSISERLRALGPDPDPLVVESLVSRMSPLLQKYSGPGNTMPAGIEAVPSVAVWERGFGSSASGLADVLSEPVKFLEESREPVLADEESLSILPPKHGLLDADVSKQPILVLPTASLYGLRSDSIEHSIVQNFAENGGVIIAFTQPYGEDFSALPVPAGQELLAAGWKQDLSCFSNSAYPCTDHPILSGITSATITAGIDGFFRKVPSNAEVLLRRKATGEPCMIVYPVGDGYVIATTMYEDWAYSNGQSTRDGRGILANAISWAKNHRRSIPSVNLSQGGSASSIPLTLSVHNLSDTAVDQIEIIVMSPDRQAEITRFTQAVSIPAQSEADISVSVSMPSLTQYGVFHADYRLFAFNSIAGQEEEIQPQGETDSGRFIVERPGQERLGVRHTVFSVSVQDDVAGNPAAPVHVHLEDKTGTARQFHIWLNYAHDPGQLVQSFSLPAYGTLDVDLIQDLTRPGTYRYFLMDPDHGIQNFWPQWAFLYGNDPWRCAAVGWIVLNGNVGQSLLAVGQVQGLSTTPYEPAETITGAVPLTNPRPLPVDVSVAFTLAAAGESEASTAQVHLAPGETQSVPFALALPGPVVYFSTALLTVQANIGQATVAGTTKLVSVNPWYPQLELTPSWPAPPLGGTSMVVPVLVTNGPGAHVADAQDCSIRVHVRKRTQDGWTTVEDKLVSLPVIPAGGSANVPVELTQWQPALGDMFTVQLSAFLTGLSVPLPLGPIVQKSYGVVLPVYEGQNTTVPLGQSQFGVSGVLANPSAFTWTVDLAFDAQDAGLSAAQTVSIPPNSRQPVQWLFSRPAGVSPGTYVYTVTAAPREYASSQSASGSINLLAYNLTLAWPEAAPAFRHDLDGPLPITLQARGLAGAASAFLTATMSWGAGSATFLTAVPVALNGEEALQVVLAPPVTQMCNPGMFTVEITLEVPDASYSQTWTAAFSLGGPVYEGGFTAQTAIPGGTFGGIIENAGPYEANGQLTWTLMDIHGRTAYQTSHPVSIPIGGSLALEEPVPPTLLPGAYGSALKITDPNAATTFRQYLQVECQGTAFEFSASSDQGFYGLADPVTAGIHIQDPGRFLDGSSLHTEVRLYPKGVPQSAIAGASWGTQYSDGSGTVFVEPSGWFVESESSSSPYARQAAAFQAFDQLSGEKTVAADLNGDDNADIVKLRLGANQTVMLTVAYAPDFTNLQEYPVLTTWSMNGAPYLPGQMLLGVKDVDGDGIPEIAIGLRSRSNTSAAALMLVRMDGTVVWQKSSSSYQIPSWNGAYGLVFRDVNRDGIDDLLIIGQDLCCFYTLAALDGATGAKLWSYTSGGSLNFRVAHVAGGDVIWLLDGTRNSSTWTWTFKLRAVSASTGSYLFYVDMGEENSLPLIADVDGDGDDEALLFRAGGITVLKASGSIAGPLPSLSSGALTLLDVNLDGREDFLYLTSDYSNPQLVASDVLGQIPIWSVDVPGVYPNEAVIVPYDSPSGPDHLLIASRSSYRSPANVLTFVDMATHTVQRTLAYDPYVSGSILAGDFDGDGVSEWYQSGYIVENGCPDGAGGLTPCRPYQTIWQNDSPVQEDAQGTQQLSFDLGAIQAPGTYGVVGTARTALGQEAKARPAYFTVSAADLALDLDPAPGSFFRADEGFDGTLTLANQGQGSQADLALGLTLDGAPVSSWSSPGIAPGESQSFSFAIPPMPEGPHALVATLTAGGVEAFSTRTACVVANPAVSVTLADTPQAHTGQPFQFTIKAINAGKVPGRFTWALADDPATPVEVALAPGERYAAQVTRQAAGHYQTTLNVGGDQVASVPVSIPFGYDVQATFPAMEPQEVGNAYLHVYLDQYGPLAYADTLTALVTCADGSSDAVTYPVQIAARSSADFWMPLTVGVPGPVHVHLTGPLSGLSADTEFLAFRGGMGTVQAALPSALGDGFASVPFTVTNSLGVEGAFEVALAWSSSREAQEVLAVASLVLPPYGNGSGVLNPDVPQGEGTLQLLLNGVSVASQTLTIKPNIRAELALTAVQPSGAPPAAQAVIRNTGFQAVEAVLVINADQQAAETIHLEAGEEALRSVEVDPDAYLDEEAPISVALHLPDGSRIEQSITLALTPAQLAVLPPPAPVVFVPGAENGLSLTIENTGDQSAQVVLRVAFNSGEQELFEERVLAAGRAQTPASIAIPLWWDTPTGSSFAHYEVIREDASGGVLAQGDIQVTISGATVTADAHLEGVAYPVGATSTLTLNLDVTPAGSGQQDVVARIIAGGYEEDRPLSVTGPRSEVFSVPVAEDTDGVTVQVLQPGGRSLYINRFRVYPLSSGFSIYPDKNVYNAGESVQISAALPSQGSLRLNFLGQDVTLTGSGTVIYAFTTPADAAEDAYTVAYDYSPDDPSLEPASGGIPVDVHGVVVSGGESRLSKGRYMSGETIGGEVTLLCNSALTGSLRLWVVYPDGSHASAGAQPATLVAGVPGRIPISVPFSTTMGGTHRLSYSFVGASGVSYVGGSLPFSSGGATLLSASLDQLDFPYATEPVVALIRAAGVGAATVAIEVDGSTAGQTGLEVNGVSSQAITLVQPGIGEHSLKATLVDASGMLSTAYTRFVYGSRLPDLSGAVFAAGREGNTQTLAVTADNRGASATSECQASVYDGDPLAGGVLIGTAVLPPIQPGGSAMQSVLWDVTAMQGLHEVHLVVDSAFQVREWDESNNTAHASVTLLPTPAILIAPEENACSKTEVTPTVEVTPAGYTVTLTLNEQPYTLGTPIQGEGDYSLAVTATDPSSAASFTDTRHFFIDATPPVFQVNSPADGACERPAFVPDIQGTDLHGITWAALLNGQSYAVGSPILTEGDWTLSVSAADSCGNASQTVGRSFVTDGTAPLISVVSPLEGETVQPGTVPDIQGSDPHGVNWTLTLNGQIYALGAAVNEPGEYTLVVLASDDCGNATEALTRHFTVQGTVAPSLPLAVNRFAWFGCDSLTVEGNTKSYGVPSVGGAQGFGGHIGSNGDIRVNGTNTINGNATPGPGRSVVVTGNQDQVLGSKSPAPVLLACEEQSVSGWAVYALAHNSNAAIPSQFLNAQGEFTVSGNHTCTLPPGTYSVSSLILNGNATLNVTGPVVFVVGGEIKLVGNAKANENGDPHNLILVSNSTATVKLNGDTKASLKVYAPRSPITLNGNVTSYGNLWGRTVAASSSVVWNRVRDSKTPSLLITEPPGGSTSTESSVKVGISYQDQPGGTGVDPTSLHVALDGAEITGLLAVSASGATGQSPLLGDGDHVLQAVVRDYEGNEAQAQTTFTTW